jgi:hypothetical protein
MPHINPVELANRFQVPGGYPWAAFMDRLLAAACWQAGIPGSELRTNLRTDIRDGGVDTRVSAGSNRDFTGFLGDPSIWQYKAAHEANLSDTKLLAEVTKRYAKRRIRNGDAFRLCLAVQLIDEKRTQLEENIAKQIASFHPNGPAPRVLTVDNIARIASHFPNFLHDYHGLEFQSRTLTFPAWGKTITARTPAFVPSASFEALRQRIEAFTDPAAVPDQPLLVVHGKAAVGKTRSVYEALARIKASSATAVYTDDARQALEFAYILANNEEMSAVLVVDDISLESRHRLGEVLEGYKHRVRTVAIQHDSEPGDAELESSYTFHFEQQSVDRILLANFKEIPIARLGAYVSLSESYLRFAVDLCRQDGQIRKSQGDVIPTLQAIMDYYRRSLGEKQDYVDSLALFTRVGREEDVTEELDKLCSWRGFDRRIFEQRCSELKDAPGFVDRSAIYYRIRPAVIAKHAFASAWKKWIAGREQTFLKWTESLSKDMQASFLLRVKLSAGDPERQIVRNFFQEFVSGCRGADLSNGEKVSRLVALAEIDPEHYLPQLRSLVESASDREIGRERPVGLGWGPRRQLVFLAVEMAKFTAFFADAEKILFRLSQVEIEPNIANNASGEWERLFRPKLSGTPIPFRERAALLKQRLPKSDRELKPAAERALKMTFDYYGSGRSSQPTIAGRIPDPEWRVETQAQQEECIVLCLRLLSDTAEARSEAADTDKTWRLLADAVFLFVQERFLEIVEHELRVDRLPEKARAEIHSRLNRLATRSGIYQRIPQNILSDEYAEKVMHWLASLPTSTLLARIIRILGDITDWTVPSAADSKLLAEAAGEFLQLFRSDPQQTRLVLDWAYSVNTHGNTQFGVVVGKADTPGFLLQPLIDRAISSEQTEFVRGYLSGASEAGVLDVARLNVALDEVEKTKPAVAFRLAHVVAEQSRAFTRTLEQVKRGVLAPSNLTNFTVYVGNHKTTIEDAKQALAVIMPMEAAGKPGVAGVALEFVAYQYYRLTDPQWTAIQDTDFDELAWQVLDACTKDRSIHGHWWSETLNALAAHSDPRRAAGLLVKAMCGESFHLRQEADEVLGKFAMSRPQVAMDALGEIMQDEHLSRNLPYEKLSCFGSLPPEVLGAWLDQHGSNGAFAVANYIPAPYVDKEDGQPKLHPLTELFLGKYADEDRVFHHYAGQLHALQSYKGDIAQLKENEAEVARRFLNHPLKRVRDWAEYEVKDATREATQFRSMLDKQRL